MSGAALRKMPPRSRRWPRAAAGYRHKWCSNGRRFLLPESPGAARDPSAGSCHGGRIIPHLDDEQASVLVERHGHRAVTIGSAATNSSRKPGLT